MDKVDQEVTSIFEETNALLHGHFILRSGLRSAYFFQCAQVCQHMDKVTRLAQLLIQKIPVFEIDLVVAPAMGGLVIGQEVARQLGSKFIFLEKVNDRLALRRNFTIHPRQRIILVEDVVTRGGRVKEALEIINPFCENLLGVASLVDRSTETLDFGVPFYPLLKMNFPTYSPDQLPQELARLAPTKPGS